MCDLPPSLVVRNIRKTTPCVVECCTKKNNKYFLWLANVLGKLPLKSPLIIAADKPHHSWRLVNPGELGLDLEFSQMTRDFTNFVGQWCATWLSSVWLANKSDKLLHITRVVCFLVGRQLWCSPYLGTYVSQQHLNISCDKNTFPLSHRRSHPSSKCLALLYLNPNPGMMDDILWHCVIDASRDWD